MTVSADTPLRYMWGVVGSVSPDRMDVECMGKTYRLRRPSIASLREEPRPGDVWRFHCEGHGYVADERLELAPLPDPVMHEGDVCLSSRAVLYLRAALLDVSDVHGPLFDPVTGIIDESRLPERLRSGA